MTSTILSSKVLGRSNLMKRFQGPRVTSPSVKKMSDKKIHQMQKDDWGHERLESLNIMMNSMLDQELPTPINFDVDDEIGVEL